jgi:diacylglycerol kinase (ATP)
MRVMLLYNPIAGTGRSQAAAETLAPILRNAGYDPVPLATRADPPTEWLEPQLREVRVAVVIGGDGAMRLAGTSAMRSQTPLYHWPSGTENLFSREFGFDRSPSRLLAALERFEVRQIDVGMAHGEPFLIMASIGIDSSIAHDLAARRDGGISHLSYIVPILRQLSRWRPSALTIEVDGKTVVESEPGVAIVANSRHYAIHLDPALRASMSDGLLDVVFFPCRSSLSALGWMILALFRRHVASSRVVYRNGRAIELRSSPARPYQLDGDAASLGSAISELSITLEPGALPVLVPVGDHEVSTIPVGAEGLA